MGQGKDGAWLAFWKWCKVIPSVNKWITTKDKGTIICKDMLL